MLRIGLWCVFGGLAAAMLGVISSGGFGPCGPQHPGPFFFALAGLTAFAIGAFMLVGEFFRAAFGKLKASRSSNSR